MGEQRYAVRDIKGFTPGIDAAQSEEQFALGGRNYMFDSRGVKSPFGNRFLTPIQFDKPQHVHGVRLRLRGGDRAFVFAAHGILEWSESLGGWATIYSTPDTTLAPYRWTFEYLAGNLYFAHPRVGCLVLNLDTGICAPHTEVGTGTPDQVIAVGQNNGRLILLTSTLFSWSAPSNGLNFTPGFGGAGAQVLAERVAGDPILLTSYSRGVLTWTSGGVMRSEFTGDTMVYRHRQLSTEYRPINSFCSVRIDEDTSIILDERGLFQSRGESVTPYAPLFNEFLIDWIQQRDYNIGQNVRLEWDDLRRWLFVSYSDSYADPLYERAFIYYPPLEKWGEFNESHYGILPYKIVGSERADDYFGFIDSAGRPRYWLGTGSREKSVESTPEFKLANLYQPAIQKPSQYAVDEEGTYLGSAAKVRTFSAEGIDKPSGYYANGSVSPLVTQVTGLDSLFRFGYIRLYGDSAADQLTDINSVIVRSVKSGESDVLKLDFNLNPPGVVDTDFNAGSGQYDLGVDPLNYINHTLRLVGTLDGETEFMVDSPVLADFQQASRMYASHVSGLWIIVEIGAESVGEAYHIRTFEITATSGGRYL